MNILDILNEQKKATAEEAVAASGEKENTKTNINIEVYRVALYRLGKENEIDLSEFEDEHPEDREFTLQYLEEKYK